MSTETLRKTLTQLTCDLIAIPSVAERPDQLSAVIDYVEQQIRALPGVFVERSEDNGKPSLVATLRNTRAPQIMLNAHLDVVPGRAEQFQPSVRDGRIYGRGSQDMKGAGAVLLQLLKDLAAQPAPPDVGFMFVSDEEIGGMNGTNYLQQQGWSCEFFLAAEPTDMDICYEQKGVMWVTVQLKGQPAHGSRPWDGSNAFAALRSGLAAMEQRFPTPDEAAWLTTVVPTIIQGGEASNRLPESILLTLDIRRLPQETPEQIVAALRECYPEGSVELISDGPPLLTDPQDAYVQRLADCAARVLDRPAHLYREHFASDARFYSAANIPAVCFGPVGAGLHSDEEWVTIDSLVQLYQVLDLLVR